jgi:hypothetical protein
MPDDKLGFFTVKSLNQKSVQEISELQSVLQRERFGWEALVLATISSVVFIVINYGSINQA